MANKGTAGLSFHVCKLYFQYFSGVALTEDNKLGSLRSLFLIVSYLIYSTVLELK